MAKTKKDDLVPGSGKDPVPGRLGWAGVATLVETVSVEMNPVKVRVYLHKPTMEFGAEYLSKTYVSRDGAALVRTIKELLEQTVTFSWQPLIMAAVLTHKDKWYEAGESVGLTFDRFYITKLPTVEFDGKPVQEVFAAERYVRLDWDTWHNHPNDLERATLAEIFYSKGVARDKNGELQFPCDVGVVYPGDRPKMYIPYDEEMWKALETAQERIVAVRKTLQELLSPQYLADFRTTFAGGMEQPSLSGAEPNNDIPALLPDSGVKKREEQV